MEFDKETQVRILQVAAGREQGTAIEGIDQRIAHIMDMHPEFDEIWKKGELATYPQEINGQIVSPFVHTVLHVTVDKQILTGSPVFVGETLERLKGQGMEEHPALHAIIAEFGDLHFEAFRCGKPFDFLEYETRLLHLSFEGAE